MNCLCEKYPININALNKSTSCNCACPGFQSLVNNNYETCGCENSLKVYQFRKGM